MRHGPRRTTVADSCGFPGKRRRGGNLPPGKFSWVASGDAPPHFLFRLAEKKTGRTRKGYAASVSGKAANGCAVHGPKEKAAWAHSGAVALRAHGGRRIGACSDFGPPSGTLSSSARSMLPSRGGRCGGRRGGCRIASASLFAAAYAPVRKSQRQRKSAQGVSFYLPGLEVSPRAGRFRPLTSTRAIQPSPAGGRRSALAQTDPPKHFFFSTGRGAEGELPRRGKRGPSGGFSF